jgi:succinate-acetate transporter protein
MDRLLLDRRLVAWLVRRFVPAFGHPLAKFAHALYYRPTLFFPFVLMWGGVAQFIAGIKGFPARDILATVFHTLWGSFWISFGIVYLLAAVGSVPALSLHGHFSEFGAWAVVLMVFTWICAIVSPSSGYSCLHRETDTFAGRPRS